MSINSVAPQVLQLLVANSEKLSDELTDLNRRSEFYRSLSLLIQNSPPILAQRMQRELTVIIDRSEVMRFNNLVQDGNQRAIEEWVSQNQANRLVNGESFIAALQSACQPTQDNLKKAVNFLSISALSPAKRSLLEPITLARWINFNHVPLAEANLSMDKLKSAAPFLRYVDCRGLPIQNLHDLVPACTNAEEIYLSSDTLVKLRLLPRSLKILDCSHCPHLESVDLSTAVNLEKIYFRECYALGALDVSRQPALIELIFTRTQIKSIDLTRNLSLQTLICSHSPIQYLELKKNKELVELDCSYCPIAWPWLELYNNAKLQKLYFHGTSIGYHDLTYHPELIEFGCSGSQMNWVNLFKCPNIRKVFINGCPIPALHLLYNPLLTELEANNTLLSWLDLTLTPLLQKVRVSNNIHLECIYGDPLKECRVLIADNCPSLTTIPPTPKETLFSSSGCFTFYTSLKEIEKDPSKVMIELSRHVHRFSHPGFVMRGDNHNFHMDKRQFRQFFRLLMDNLFKSGFSLEMGYEGDIAKIGDLHALCAFARLICFSASYPVAMGPHLNHMFMQALLTLSPKEIDVFKDKDPIFRELFAKDKEENVNLFMLLLKMASNCYLGESNADTIDKFTEIMRTNNSINNSETKPLINYAQEIEDRISFLTEGEQQTLKIMAKIFTKDTQEWGVNGVNEFINKVEGAVMTKERLLELIRVHHTHLPSDALKTIKYFRFFLDEYPEKIKRIADSFPGTYEIKGEPIDVTVLHWREQDQPPVLLSAQEIEIPLYETYKQFKEKFLALF